MSGFARPSDARLAASSEHARPTQSLRGDRGAPNAKATALLVATGAQDAAVTGAACVARFKHDLANPLSVSLGNETAPAFLAERCWLQRARNDTKPVSYTHLTLPTILLV